MSPILTYMLFPLDNMKSKDTVNLSILKKESDILDINNDEDDDSDEIDEEDKDDINDLADDTDLSEATNVQDDEEDDEDELDEYDDGDWDTLSSTTAKSKSTTSTSTSTTTTTTPVSAPDPYFTHFDPRNEHQSYKEAQVCIFEAWSVEFWFSAFHILEASNVWMEYVDGNILQKRLEETHREKVTKVMKDWSDLEERYQEMRQGDPRGAEDFKQRMTRRFQQTVQALEEEGDAEKHQLAAMHQQRVLAHINQRKKEAMTCYTQALNEVPPNVSV